MNGKFHLTRLASRTANLPQVLTLQEVRSMEKMRRSKMSPEMFARENGPLNLFYPALAAGFAQTFNAGVCRDTNGGQISADTAW